MGSRCSMSPKMILACTNSFVGDLSLLNIVGKLSLSLSKVFIGDRAEFPVMRERSLLVR